MASNIRLGWHFKVEHIRSMRAVVQGPALILGDTWGFEFIRLVWTHHSFPPMNTELQNDTSASLTCLLVAFQEITEPQDEF